MFLGEFGGLTRFFASTQSQDSHPLAKGARRVGQPGLGDAFRTMGHAISGVSSSRRGQTHTISIFSSTSFLSFSSKPVSSKELVSTALPFSTLVIT